MPESHIIGDLGKNDSLGESTATTPHSRDITAQQEGMGAESK